MKPVSFMKLMKCEVIKLNNLILWYYQIFQTVITMNKIISRPIHIMLKLPKKGFITKYNYGNIMIFMNR